MAIPVGVLLQCSEPATRTDPKSSGGSHARGARRPSGGLKKPTGLRRYTPMNRRMRPKRLTKLAFSLALAMFGCGTGSSSSGDSTDTGTDTDTDGDDQVTVIALGAGRYDTCVAFSNDTIRCWGRYTTNGEAPGSVDAMDAGGEVAALEVGDVSACALMESGDVRCWLLDPEQAAERDYGAALLGAPVDGDADTPTAAGAVPIGAPVVSLSVGVSHACAVTTAGGVRCWGAGADGQLGYASTQNVGDDETPADMGDVPLLGPALQVSAGVYHTCALLESREVQCWGRNMIGELGYGHTDPIGDDESPIAAGPVDVGGSVAQLNTLLASTCALMDDGAVRCWGGHGSLSGPWFEALTIGDDEPASEAPLVDLGGAATSIVSGSGNSCAVLESGSLRCWGLNMFGELGYGNTVTVGGMDGPSPAQAGDVDLGGVPVALSSKLVHFCALLESGAVRCWGSNRYGRLGFGGGEDVGDDELPVDGPLVELPELE